MKGTRRWLGAVGVAIGVLWLGGIRGGVAIGADPQGRNGLEHGAGRIEAQAAVAPHGGAGWLNFDPGDDPWPAAGADGRYRVIDACRYDPQLQREHERILCEGHRVLWRVGEQLRDEALESVKWNLLGSVGRAGRLGLGGACGIVHYGHTVAQTAKREVVVVGEGMNRIEEMARRLRVSGLSVRTYPAPNMNRVASPNVYGSRRSLDANWHWIDYWVRNKRLDVIDIGRQPARTTPSPYYQMESRNLRHWEESGQIQPVIRIDPGF